MVPKSSFCLLNLGNTVSALSEYLNYGVIKPNEGKLKWCDYTEVIRPYVNLKIYNRR